MSLIIYPLSFVIILSIVVFVHEFGHYYIAKKSGIFVSIFSIGFGKILFSKKDREGTIWQFCLIPFGGYVKMFGDEDATSFTSETNQQDYTEAEKKKSFFYQKNPIKIAILFGGPLANYLLAIVLFAFLFIIYGRAVSQPVIIGFTDNSVAKEAGLQIDDQIIKVDNKKIKDIRPLRQAIELKQGKPIVLQYQRNNEIYKVTVKPIKLDNQSTNSQQYAIGILTEPYAHQTFTLTQAFKTAFVEVYDISITTLRALGQMIKGERNPKELSGPIQIAQHSGKAMQDGFSSFMFFIAFLSTSLGLINLLPIPLLDGGQILLYAIEILYRRKLPNLCYVWFQRIGLVLIGLLSIFTIFNDLFSIFKR